jgi:uncharacterized protein
VKIWHDYDDLQRLHEALIDLPEENEGMLLPEFDGYCAGLLVCPEMILPSEWLHQVWGSHSAPEFASMEQMQRVLDLVMGHYNRVSEMLMPPAHYAPVIDEDSTSGALMWEFWVEGFMSAVALRPNAWKTLTRDGDDEALAAMLAMMDLSRFARDRSKYSDQEQAERDAGAVDVIIDCVLAFNRFTKGQPAAGGVPGMSWPLPDSHAANTPFAPGIRAKVGRNDPCPCGSGKKYKKCCVAN